MKRFILFFVICLFSIQNLFAFDYLTHEQISISVAGLFNFKNKNLFCQFKNGSNFPDRDSRQGLRTLYYYHFYNPSDIDAKERKKKSALTYMYNFYCKAILNHKKGNYEEAMFNLGCAAHYIQDMCCMVHQMDWYSNLYNLVKIDLNSSNEYHKKIINAHAEYEKIVNSVVMDKIQLLEEKYSTWRNENKYTDPRKFAVYYADNLYKNKQFDKNTMYNKNDIEDIEVSCAYKATYFLMLAFFSRVKWTP
ncbi:MAG: zinc dependent phospholipase C family protein [Anaeroplasma sp.]